MSQRWTAEDLARVSTRLRGAIATPLEQRSKYGNRKVEFQGQKFDSAGELEAYKAFKLQELAGAIRSVIRQVSLPLQGSNRRIRLDFATVENDGRIRWFDFKGYVTAAWASKRDQIQSAYGITIEII